MRDLILERHRREARPLADHGARDAAYMYQLCPACGVEVLGGGYCPDCHEEMARRGDGYQFWPGLEERRRLEEDLDRAGKWCGRFEVVFYGALFCGLSGYLAWKLAPWFIALFRMWFGGN